MKEILYKLFEHQYLGRKEAREILQGITQGKYNDAQIASLITVFLMRSISVEELIGFREALLEMRIPVDLNEFGPIDIVGTGGDGKNSGEYATVYFGKNETNYTHEVTITVTKAVKKQLPKSSSISIQ